MGNLISVGFPAVVFSTECCIIMVSFNCDRSLWRVKNVLANFQNIRTDKANLAKSLRNTYKGVAGCILKWQVASSFVYSKLINVWLNTNM